MTMMTMTMGMREKRRRRAEKEAKEKYIQKGNSNDLKNWKMLLSLRVLSSSSLRARFSYFLFRALHSSLRFVVVTFHFSGPSLVCRARRYMWQQEKLMKHLPMVVEWNEPQKNFFFCEPQHILDRIVSVVCCFLEKREKWKRLAGNFVSVCVCAPRVVVVWRKWSIINWAWSPKKRKLHTQYQTAVKSTQLVLACAVDVSVCRA